MKLRYLLLAIPLLAACSESTTKPTEIGNAVTITVPTTIVIKKAQSAKDVVEAFKAKGLPVAEVVDFTAETDKNGDLGRPHQYTSKTSWHDSRLPADPDGPSVPSGGSVEFFANDADAKLRFDYLDEIQKAMGALVGNDYMFLHGRVFIRVSEKLTPEQAGAYDWAKL